MVWTPVPDSTGTPATAVLGQPNLTVRGTGLGARDMTGPWGICGSGTRLFVTDISASRVLAFSLTP